MQDFTGVPCIVDLATMREAVTALGGDPEKVNPLAPAEMVIDHSVIADVFGSPEAFGRNVEIEYERNRERYQFLRWGQGAFDDFKVVPPGTGIVHQVNIEHLARVVFPREVDGVLQAYEIHNLPIGRSMEELLRKLKASRFVHENGGEVCPALACSACASGNCCCRSTGSTSWPISIIRFLSTKFNY